MMNPLKLIEKDFPYLLLAMQIAFNFHLIFSNSKKIEKISTQLVDSRISVERIAVTHSHLLKVVEKIHEEAAREK